MCGLFSCKPIFRCFFKLKSAKKCVCVIRLKIILLLVKNIFFGLNGGISELVAQVAQKPTANEFKTQYFGACHQTRNGGTRNSKARNAGAPNQEQ